MRDYLIFNSRRHAGQILTEELNRRGVKPDLVLGLARGGVAVAAEIAAAFKVPLEPLIVRKISPPENPEFAIGAIAAMPSIFVWWDKDTIRRLGLSPDWQKRQIRDKKVEILNYLSQISIAEKHTRQRVKNRNKILLVDDGAATGATMLAALEAIRKGFKNRKITVALPVASLEAAEKIKQQADEAVILSVDPDFRAVGQYYREFNQVSWEEVKILLQLNNEAYRKTHPRKTPQKHDRSGVGNKRG